MRRHGRRKSTLFYRQGPDICGEDQKMSRKGLIAQGISIIRHAGQDSRSIAQQVCKCLVVVVAGLALTSCSATLAKWTSRGGPSPQTVQTATSGYSSGTLPLVCPQLPTPPPNVASSATTSKAPSSAISRSAGGSPLVIPKCPRSIPAPNPMPEWAKKMLLEMQARGLNR